MGAKGSTDMKMKGWKDDWSLWDSTINGTLE